MNSPRPYEPKTDTDMSKTSKKTNTAVTETVGAQSGKRHRSAATGKFVKSSTAARRPRTTVTERSSESGIAAASFVSEEAGNHNAQARRFLTPKSEGAVNEATIERLVAEVDQGIPAEKLRRRGRPSIGLDASSTYSVRLPEDLVALIDERSAMDGVSRGETMRCALIDYLTN